MTVFGREGDEKSKMRNRSAAIRGLSGRHRRRGVALGTNRAVRAAEGTPHGDERGRSRGGGEKRGGARAREEAKETMDDIDAHPGRKLSADVLAKLAAVFA